MKGGWVYILASKSFLALLDAVIGTIPKRLGF
jgi:hypothetical protein